MCWYILIECLIWINVKSWKSLNTFLYLWDVSFISVDKMNYSNRFLHIEPLLHSQNLCSSWYFICFNVLFNINLLMWYSEEGNIFPFTHVYIEEPGFHLTLQERQYRNGYIEFFFQHFISFLKLKRGGLWISLCLVTGG